MNRIITLWTFSQQLLYKLAVKAIKLETYWKYNADAKNWKLVLVHLKRAQIIQHDVVHTYA